MGVIDKIRSLLPLGSRGRRPRSHAGRRTFAAAQTTNLTASWTTSPVTIDNALKSGLTPLRARSREQSYNNDYARRFINMVKSNVIGPQGIVLRSQVQFGKGKPDSAARDAIEGAWRRWGRSCDVSGRLTWKEMQRLLTATVAIDGEAIVRVHRGRFNDAGIALEVIDPQLLDVNFDHEGEGGLHVKMGVEMDRLKRPIAYHFIAPAKSSNATYWSSGGHIVVPAGEIFHLYVQEYPGQTRGVPWMATALMRMGMLNGYEEAALVNARVGASKLGVIVTEDGEYVGDDVDSDGAALVDGGDPGSWFNLAPGESIEGYDPTYPNGEFPDFVKACLRGIASGLGVHYNILANDLEGVSYSSIRQAVIEDQEVWKGMQEWIVDTFISRLFESWMDEALINGAIDINGTPLRYEGYSRYRRASWQPRRWPWIDPLKDVQANIAAIDAGLRSRSDVIREQGGDPKDVWSEVERENELLDQYGVAIGAAEFGEDRETEDE